MGNEQEAKISTEEKEKLKPNNALAHGVAGLKGVYGTMQAPKKELLVSFVPAFPPLAESVSTNPCTHINDVIYAIAQGQGAQAFLH